MKSWGPLLPLLLLAPVASATGAECTHCMHEQPVYWGIGGEVDHAARAWQAPQQSGLTTWDAFAWIGDDDIRLRFEFEGESTSQSTNRNETRVLLSWPIGEFWDLQTGVRIDRAQGQNAWADIGLHGLLPWFIETSAHVFVSDGGDVSFRLKNAIDLAITQDIFLLPHVELNGYAADIPSYGAGAGLATLESGLQLRYEFTRGFAPYVDLVWERNLGETSSISRASGEDPERTSLRFGLKFRL